MLKTGEKIEDQNVWILCANCFTSVCGKMLEESPDCHNSIFCDLDDKHKEWKQFSFVGNRDDVLQWLGHRYKRHSFNPAEKRVTYDRFFHAHDEARRNGIADSVSR